MAGVTYKCTSCGGYLSFDPETQQWKCPFCDSVFQQDELDERDAASAAAVPTSEGSQVIYRCPNCASEIMTDETTVATHCYYCHSPVVLEGRLTDDMRPDTVLPFSIDKEKAVETFMKWAKSKRYVPSFFFKQAQVEQMRGVYYPHFVTECEVEGAVDGEARDTSVADTGKYIVTTTHHYHVRREGRMRFSNIMRPALAKANRKLSDGIHPFPLDQEKPFSDAYLSGFLAERRDIEAASIQSDIENEVAGYVQPLLTDTIQHQSCSVTPSSRIKNLKSRYVLLPTWVLTYPNKQQPDDPYYYTMNGCTGEICGKLPIDRKKLWLTGLGVAGIVFVIACILSYFLW